MQASLVMFKADGTRRDFPLKGGSLVVGRKTTCELRIPLSSVSRQHCEIVVEGESIKLRDLGSSNGTYHNSVRVQEATLAAGDEVVIGPVVFAVVIDGVPAELKPVRSIIGASSGESRATFDSEAKPLGVEVNGDISDSLGGVAAEGSSPTIDLDEDPIAALKALAESELGGGGRGGVADSGEVEFDLEEFAAEDLKDAG